MIDYSFVCDGCKCRIGGMGFHKDGEVFCNACAWPRMELPTESAVGEVYRED